MSLWPGYLRLSRLLDDSLRPFFEVSTKLLTEELEKDLLLTLSEVLRQVRDWTLELDSDEEVLAEPFDQKERSVDASSCLDDRQCLVKIIGDSISLLAFSSRYVQHLASNILVAISEFVVAGERGWEDFMHFLCLCLEVAIYNTLSSTELDALETRYSYYDSSVSKSFLMKNLKCANWSEITAIVRVLRGILKYIKQDIDDRIVKVYLDSVSSLMLNVPWDLLSEIHVYCNAEDIHASVRDVSPHIKVVQPSEIKNFFGQFTQFLCSLAELSVSLASGVDFYPVTCKIINTVPILLAWSHTELQSPRHVRFSQYFRHKILMLMIKLSSRNHIEDNIALSWLHLLHKYFEDLLLQPISEEKIAQHSALEDLPFCTSFTDPGEQNMLSRHLQRLAVFLFLRCSLHLISVKEGTDEQSCYENSNHHFTSDKKFHSAESEGTRELHKWLQAHVHPGINMNHELYFQQCMRFTSSFLQLFMHEDDVLFDMLLQVICVPFPHKRQVIEGNSLSEVKNDLLLASELFNPVNLFHFFLAEIVYDHQILLDYLISKDTGSSCAEYLLRSLRIICNSWNLFVEFTEVGDGLGKISLKRQKISTDNLNFNETSCSEDHTIDSKLHRSDSRLPFMAARNCLVSLRASIDSLNQKNLFPYNPQVLLRRLMRFEELCVKGSNG